MKPVPPKITLSIRSVLTMSVCSGSSNKLAAVYDGSPFTETAVCESSTLPEVLDALLNAHRERIVWLSLK